MAYYGSVAINQGAAGLGSAAAVDQAPASWGPKGYREGLPYGKLMSYQDGVLGQRTPTGYQEGLPYGPLKAFDDGVLGRLDQQAHRVPMGQFDAPLMAYADGVVGGPPGGPRPGKLRAYRDGSLGEYFSPLRGLGQDANGPVIDMTDPLVISELKSAMSLMLPQVTLTEQGQKTYNEKWYENGLWDEAAGALWFQVAQMIAGQNGGAEAISKGSNSRRYPNGEGVVVLMGYFRDSPDYGSEYVTNSFPILDAVTAGEAVPKVTEPFFTLESKVKGEPGEEPMIASTTMAYGIGAVLLLGVAFWATSGKGKRKAAVL